LPLENRAELFKAARDMTLERLVSGRRDSRYPRGPSRNWIKLKISKSLAMHRVKDVLVK
jgi:ATP-dependent DNA ligase